MTLSRMAIFVEGYTEVLFVDKLIQEIATANSVLIEKRRIRGGGKCRRTARLIETARPHTSEKHFVLIYDCGNDELAKDRIIEEYKNLTRAGFSKVICIRDVYPLRDVKKLEMRMPLFMPRHPIVVDFILATMEIEAWFLSEFTHFGRVDPSLDSAVIHAALGFNPQVDDMSLRYNPAADLNECYKLVGKSYPKGDAVCVGHLDYSHLYLGVVNRIDYLKRLCAIIDDFLSPVECA